MSSKPRTPPTSVYRSIRIAASTTDGTDAGPPPGPPLEAIDLAIDADGTTWSARLTRDGQEIASGRTLHDVLPRAQLLDAEVLDRLLPRPDAPSLLDVSEVAHRLGISPRGVWRLTSRGQLAAVRVRGSTRWNPRSVEKYIQRSSL